jgi:hypothetical protein
MPDQVALLRLRQKQQELVRADRKITTDTVETALGCSHGLAYSIMYDRLKFRVVWARWVPKELKDKKINRMDLSLQHFLR